VGKINRYSNLFIEIDALKPVTIAEIGTWNAIHASKMITTARKHNPNIKYYGFDLFEDMTDKVKAKEIHAKKNVTKSMAETKLKSINADYELICGNTMDTLPEFVTRMKSADLTLDFVFIDGGHSLETIKSDWYWISQLMNAKSVIILDDYYVGDMSKGCCHLISNLDHYTVELLDPVDKLPNLHIRLVKVTA